MRKKTTWERTPVQNLLRNRSSGNYYGRWTITVNGKSKQKWINLNTDVFSVAKLRVADEATKIEKLRGSSSAFVAGSGTVGDLMRVYEERSKANPDLKPATITSRLVALGKLRKTWPELDGLKPTQVIPFIACFGTILAILAAWHENFPN